MIELLGEGGMATVYKARQLSLDRIVALKVLAERLADDETFVRRFEKEARALANLNHPNITDIYDRGKAGKRYFLSMEFVDGKGFRELLKAGTLSCDRILAILRAVCEALAYTHEKGIIHRDVKPENILIGREGGVKVSDFGLAAMTEDSSASPHLTKANIMVGTVNYVAPEQRRDARSVDHRADLYAVGVVLYEALTGKLPIGVCEPASQVNADVDLRLDEVIERLLQQDPDKRYQSAREVVAALDVIVGNPLGGMSPPVTGPAQLPPGPSALGCQSPEGLDALVKRAHDDISRQKTRGLTTQVRAEALDGREKRRGCLGTLALAGLFVAVVLLGVAYVEEPSVAVWLLSDLPRRCLGSTWSPAVRARVEAVFAKRYRRRRKFYAGRMAEALRGRAAAPKVGALRLVALVGKRLPWKSLIRLLDDPAPAVRSEIITLLERRMPAAEVAAVQEAQQTAARQGRREEAARLHVVVEGLLRKGGQEAQKR